LKLKQPYLRKISKKAVEGQILILNIPTAVFTEHMQQITVLQTE